MWLNDNQAKKADNLRNYIIRTNNGNLSYVECKKCKGTGLSGVSMSSDGSFSWDESGYCNKCYGAGCNVCNGKGIVD